MILAEIFGLWRPGLFTEMIWSVYVAGIVQMSFSL